MSVESARQAYESGDYESAMRLARRHLKFSPYDGRAWEVLGMVQYARTSFRSAVSALERASLLVPLKPPARVCLAHAYSKVDRAELSRDLLATLIGDESLSIPLLLQVAVGLDAVDAPNLAMQACREASRRDPSFAQAYYDLGYYAARCGQTPQITESLARKAISLEPTNVRYRVGLATLLLKQGRDSQAYHLVKDFTNDQIDEVRCSCCLQRIVPLFEQAGDYRRSILCQQRLLMLEIRDAEPDCD